MAFCKNCGSELKEGARFCEQCGTPVQQAPQAPEQPAYNYQQSTYNYQEQPAYNYQQPAYNYQQQPEQPAPAPAQSGDAKGAMIMSIIGLALSELGIPGIILCAIAKGKVKKAEAAGATGGMVKVGKILSKIGMIVSIVMTVIWAIYFFAIVGLAASGALDYIYY